MNTKIGNRVKKRGNILLGLAFLALGIFLMVSGVVSCNNVSKRNSAAARAEVWSMSNGDYQAANYYRGSQKSSSYITPVFYMGLGGVLVLLGCVGLACSGSEG